jgi:hypothetical protein
MVWRGIQLDDNARWFGEQLCRHQALWRPRAFHQPHLPWERELPQLSAALRALSLAQAEALAADDTALAQWLAPYLPFAPELIARCQLPLHETHRHTDGWPEPRDVPGRKWAQIRAFLAALPRCDLPALEWCAGKGHLGRSYSRIDGAAVTGLEWNGALVADGNRLARRESLPVELRQCDVLTEAGVAQIAPSQQLLALHACGDLHLQLLLGAAERRPHALALAPCCYHLTRRFLDADGYYRPLSAPAQAHDPRLAVIDLHTAVQESVTSSPRVIAQSRQLQAWRLGFDRLQRELRGVDTYLPTPSLPLSRLRNGFPSFCRELARHHRLELPPTIDVTRFEALGGERLREVTALDLVRLLFRRPLELWLALDRALFLAASGFEVTLGRFCERPLTPRNLLIHGQRC